MQESSNFRVLGIIPARAGSKGVPGKNIKILKGKPLVSWAIESAVRSQLFGRVLVATDDEKVVSIAKLNNIEVPFLLPEELTQDNSSIIDVIKYSIDWLKENKGEEYDYIALIEPTSPLRTALHLVEGFTLLKDTGADSVTSVVPVPADFNPHWQFTVTEQEKLTVFTGESLGRIVPRRQNLPETYTRNGVLYMFKENLLCREEPNIYGDDARAYVMDMKYSINIDTEDDFAQAEKALSDLIH